MRRNVVRNFSQETRCRGIRIWNRRGNKSAGEFRPVKMLDDKMNLNVTAMENKMLLWTILIIIGYEFVVIALTLKRYSKQVQLLKQKKEAELTDEFDKWADSGELSREQYYYLNRKHIRIFQAKMQIPIVIILLLFALANKYL